MITDPRDIEQHGLAEPYMYVHLDNQKFILMYTAWLNYGTYVCTHIWWKRSWLNHNNYLLTQILLLCALMIV